MTETNDYCNYRLEPGMSWDSVQMHFLCPVRDWEISDSRVSNLVFAETEKPGFFTTENPFLAACKPSLSVLNFYLQCLITRPY